MDISTITFVVTIAIAFIFLRWLISPIPQTNEFGLPTETANGARSTAVFNTSNASSRRSRRQVSDSMVEVVATIAPSLTREQIVYDLQKTGSVELTINNYMENNSLPFPPNAPRTATTPGSNTTTNRPHSGAGTSSTPTNAKEHQIDFKSINLLEKYQIDINDPQVSSDNELLAKKQEMIINARNRLQKQLNDQ